MSRLGAVTAMAILAAALLLGVAALCKILHGSNNDLRSGFERFWPRKRNGARRILDFSSLPPTHRGVYGAYSGETYAR